MFLPGESHGWRGLVGCGLWGRTESDTTKCARAHTHTHTHTHTEHQLHVTLFQTLVTNSECSRPCARGADRLASRLLHVPSYLITESSTGISSPEKPSPILPVSGALGSGHRSHLIKQSFCFSVSCPEQGVHRDRSFVRFSRHPWP